MSTLDRWLPFKFRRKKAEEKTVEKAPEAAETTALTPFESFFGAPISQWMRAAWGEPVFPRLAEIDQWFGDFSPMKFEPKIDVVDEEKVLRVTAELPGMTKDDVKLSIDGDVLTIRGEKRNEEESKESGVFRTERYYGFVQRSIPLPSNLDHDRTEASFDNGVLTVRLPKTTKAADKTRQIPVQG